MTRAKKAVAIVASLASVLLLGSVFLPTLCRSRDTADRVKCASNLKQVGNAIQQYAKANGGAFPDSFATIVRAGDFDTAAFCCPASNAEKAASIEALATNPTTQNCSYLYYGDGLRGGAGSDTVVMIERLEDHDGQGANVLFADGHVEFLATTRRKPAPWVANVERQAAAHARPVRLDDAGPG